MSTESRDETAEELEQRVDRLERVVETQHQMMSELEESSGILGTNVGRRDAMQAGGMLGVGALLGGVGGQKAIGTAEASHGGGHVGTPEDPVDVYGIDGEFETVSTEIASIDVHRNETTETTAPSIWGQDRQDLAAPGPRNAETIVAWQFDDVPYGTYENRDVFESRGYTADLMVNIERTDAGPSDGWIGWDEYREMAADGWEIHGHAYEHTNFSYHDDDPDWTQNDVYKTASRLLEEGLNPRYWAFPGNDPGSEMTRSILREVFPFGFVSGTRPIGYESTYSGNDLVEDGEHPAMLPRRDTDSGGTSSRAQTVIDSIDAAIQNNTSIVLYGHEIVDKPGETGGDLETEREVINDVLDHIESTSGVRFGSTTEVIRSAVPRQFGDQRSHVRTLPNGGLRIATDGADVDMDTAQIGPVTRIGSQFDYSSIASGTGEYWQRLRADESNANAGAIQTRTSQNTVSTSAVAISVNDRCSKATVFGEDTSQGTINFIDEILWTQYGGVTVIDSQERNTPAERTYNVSGNELELTMASDEYYVLCESKSFRKSE